MFRFHRTTLASAVMILASITSTSAAEKKPSLKASPATQSSSAPDKVLGNHWYTITVAGIPYGYYNDRIELRKGRLFFQNHVWKKEEGFLNEEQLGAYAEDGAELKPLFFNFHSTYRASELNIDGTVTSQGRELTLKVRKGDQELPSVKKGISTKAIFSVFFPIWLSRKVTTLKPGQSEHFLAIAEDNLEQAFPSLDGRVRAEKEPRRYKVSFRGIDSLWQLDESGAPVEIEMLQQKMRVKRVSEEEARRFLN